LIDEKYALCSLLFSHSIENIARDDGTSVASLTRMARVLELPKVKAPEKGVSVARQITAKVVNIADWTPRYEVEFNSLNVDAWPFCAA
jgi:hypothetical protein